MEEKRINKNIVFSIIAVVLLIVAVVGATYAYFSATASTEQQTVTTGTLTMGFTDGEILRATGITPIADSEIKTKATELPFSVTNTGSEHMNLTISLTDITISEELKDVDFRWGLYNADTGVGLSFGIFKDLGTETSTVIYRDTIIDAADPDITKNYILRVWIHDDGALQNYMQGKSFSAKVTVDGEAIEYTPESCFTFDDGTITGYSDTCPKDVVIPKTINNVAVTTLGVGSFTKNDPIDGYAGIGITSVILSDSISEISNQAFFGNRITHLTLPEGVTSISNALYNNPLSSIFIPETTNLGDAVINSDNIGTIILKNNFSFFVQQTKLKNLILMEGVTKLDSNMIGGLEATSIEIPTSVEEISEYAFLGLSNLSEIVVRGKTEAPAGFAENWNCIEYDFATDGCGKNVNVVFRP